MLCLQFVFFSTFQKLISFEFCSVHCYLVLKRKDKKIASFGDSHFAKSDGFRRQKDCQKIANEKATAKLSLFLFVRSTLGECIDRFCALKTYARWLRTAIV